MKITKTITLIFIALFIISKCNAQDKFSISGNVNASQDITNAQLVGTFGLSGSYKGFNLYGELKITTMLDQPEYVGSKLTYMYRFVDSHWKIEAGWGMYGVLYSSDNVAKLYRNSPYRNQIELSPSNTVKPLYYAAVYFRGIYLDYNYINKTSAIGIGVRTTVF